MEEGKKDDESNFCKPCHSLDNDDYYESVAPLFSWQEGQGRALVHVQSELKYDSFRP